MCIRDRNKDEKGDTLSIIYEHLERTIDMIPPVFFLGFHQTESQMPLVTLIRNYCYTLKLEMGTPTAVEISKLLNSTGAEIRWQLRYNDRERLRGYLSDCYFLAGIMLLGILPGLGCGINRIFINDAKSCFEILKRIDSTEDPDQEKFRIRYISSNPSVDIVKLCMEVNPEENIDIQQMILPISSSSSSSSVSSTLRTASPYGR